MAAAVTLSSALAGSSGASPTIVLTAAPLATVDEQNGGHDDLSGNSKGKAKKTTDNNHSDTGGNNKLMKDIDVKVQSMECRIESLSEMMNGFRLDVLSAIQQQSQQQQQQQQQQHNHKPQQNGNKNLNTEVEYL